MNDRIAAALALGLAATTVQSAESFPARPIRVVVAAAAGGGSDFVGRVVSQKVSDTLGLPMVIDNRGGAAGIVGADLVAKSEPDVLAPTEN